MLEKMWSEWIIFFGCNIEIKITRLEINNSDTYPKAKQFYIHYSLFLYKA